MIDRREEKAEREQERERVKGKKDKEQETKKRPYAALDWFHFIPCLTPALLSNASL